jgi:hypothetical protein
VAQPIATQTALPVFVPPTAPATPTPDRSAWQRAMLTSGLRPATKLVALAVSVHAAPEPADGTVTSHQEIAACAPGLAALIEEVGYSRSHVLRQIRLLRDHDWLVTIGRPAPGRPTVYGLTLPAVTSPPPRPARIVSDAPSRARAAKRRRAPNRGRIPASAMDAPASPTDRPSGIVDLLDAIAATPATPGATPAARGAVPEGTGPAPTAAASDVPAPVTQAATETPAGMPASATRPSETPAAASPLASGSPAADGPGTSGPSRGTQAPLPGTSAPAAAQVIAILARALRCEPLRLAELTVTVCDILDAGLWPAVELAAHLADGAPATVVDPAGLLDTRIADLPATPHLCGCRPCVSLRPTRVTPQASRARVDPSATSATPASTGLPASSRAGAVSTAGRATRANGARQNRRRPVAATTGPAPAPVMLPELAEIEQAAAAGAAQARQRRDNSR